MIATLLHGTTYDNIVFGYRNYYYYIFFLGFSLYTLDFVCVSDTKEPVNYGNYFISFVKHKGNS